jgi:hypothetical protein
MTVAVTIGLLFALAIGVFGTLVGLDRSRSFYSVILIVIASYYCLFAVMDGSIAALWTEVAIFAMFGAVAVIGFKTNRWWIVAALVAHGLMDLIHHNLVSNPGVPVWWPPFCSAIDIALASYLALLIAKEDRACS